MDEKRLIDQRMLKSPSGYNSAMTIVGPIIFLIVFGAFLCSVYYIQFQELSDVKNRLQKLESLVNISRHHGTFNYRHKRDDTYEKLRTTRQPMAQQVIVAATSSVVSKHRPTQVVSKHRPTRDCCAKLAHPSFSDKSVVIQNITLTANESVTLLCRATGFPFPRTKWTFNNALLKKGSRNRTTRTKNGQELKITRVKVEDSGLYGCRIKNVFGVKKKYMNLHVFEPGSVTVVPKTITVEENNETLVTILCTVWGNPKPTITWYYMERNGDNREISVPVNNDTYPQTSTLNLTYPDANDAGTYICAVSNLYEQQNSSSTLTVLSQPYILDSYPDSELVEQNGHFVALKCDVIGYPKPDISWIWKKVNDLTVGVHIDPNNGSLILGIVTAINSGEYECSANNSYGIATATVNLIIKVNVSTKAVMPKIALSSRRMILQCSVEGTPTPTVTWTKRTQDTDYDIFGNSYVVLGKTLVIIPDNIVASGVYICTARNRFESHRSQIIVYRNMGTLDCGTNFNHYSMQDSGTFRGLCPSHCRTRSGNHQSTYKLNSNICHSATLSNMKDPNGYVMWYKTARYVDFLAWEETPAT